MGLIQSIISGLLLGGIYSLISVGLALIVGVVELVNFAHAEYLMISMYLTYWCFEIFKIDPYLALPITFVIMAAFGYLTYKVVMKRILHANHEIKMLATFGLSLIFQNLALILFKADFRNVRTSYSTKAFKVLGGISFNAPRLIAFAVSMAVSLMLYLFLMKTYTGKSMRAISQNNKAAQLMGIRLDRTYMLAFTLGISMVAIAGAILVPIYPTNPMVGSTFLLPAFVVVTIGGLSNIPGAIVGGLIVGVVENVSAYLFGPEYQQIAYFILFLLVIILKPEGILSVRKEKGGMS